MNTIVTGWLEVAAVEDIPVRGSRVLRSPAGDIALLRAADGVVFALYDKCPHGGGPLSQGIVHGHSVTCPLHNWVICLKSGEAQGADRGCTPNVPVRVENGRVLVRAASLVGQAA